MNGSTAIIIQARLNSQRCKNKMLRKFDDLSLFELQLNKLNKLAENPIYRVYCAVGEEPFFKILKNYKFVNLVKRDKKSVSSDAIEDVFNYLKEVKEEVICFVNACAPLLNISKLKKALELYDTLKLKSLTTVIEKKTWYFDNNNKPINDNSSCNTKDLLPFYECTHNFHIFKKEYFIKNKKYWENQENDPYLFKVDFLESLDIDTEEEFIYIEKIYKALKDSSL